MAFNKNASFSGQAGDRNSISQPSQSPKTLAAIDTTSKMFNQPEKLFLFIGLFLIPLSFFQFTRTLDIHVHDTYYVIALNQVCLALAAVLIIFGFLYMLTSRLLFSPFLTWTHIIFTIFSVIFILSSPWWISLVNGNLSDDPLKRYEQRRIYSTIIYSITFILFAGQLTYIVNLIAGIIKRYK